eukprot:Skav230521  [mRNA]  locus=scaffold4943:110791:111009:+ [translate_table: standard]
MINHAVILRWPSSWAQEIDHIASSIADLHCIFKELAVHVIDQGSILDRIDYNIEQATTGPERAHVRGLVADG